ncbi:integrase/recombinase [Gemmobacter nanjingensis]|uniref:Integrase/recombinase n=1 Tax=Gemmobacter nanjingensis TaxID=488454 RepID=A0ABQ3F820_9RHOB|nr:tyrosine-type recombinase/integrase [Gemmobacter nanjingensis]GHC12776.1 integrase/recombinase [Gemmobacter nanjingensis]
MLPRVQRIRRGDRVLCYHRPTGTRLPDLPEDHPEFVAAWARAESGMPDRAPPVASGSVAKIIRDVRQSKRFLDYSDAYRAAMLRHMDAIADSYGKAPVSGVRAKHIEADLSKLDANPANARLKAWRLIMDHAETAGLAEKGLTASVGNRIVKTDGHATWSQAEVDRFRARWPIGTPQRAALELLAWTGARVSDGARLSRGNIGADGVLSFRQAKTSGMAYVPWTSPLPTWARGWEAERATMREAVMIGNGFTLLETSYGKARSIKGLSNLISDAAVLAGIVGRSAHGLRKYRLTAIAEAGGTAHAIMAWGGHTTLSEAERYTRAANRKAMIIGAEQEQNAVNAAPDTCKQAK